MAQAPVLRGDWDFEVERGPDWLFVQPRRLRASGAGGAKFAEQVWAILEQHFTHRVVLELDRVDALNSHLVSQLLLLKKRIASCEGMIRLAGLSERNEEVLSACGLDGCFPCYRNREDAVMGHAHPRQPR
jgi:anti-anti-sigma regulatory factor